MWLRSWDPPGLRPVVAHGPLCPAVARGCWGHREAPLPRGHGPPPPTSGTPPFPGTPRSPFATGALSTALRGRHREGAAVAQLQAAYPECFALSLKKTFSIFQKNIYLFF